MRKALDRAFGDFADQGFCLSSEASCARMLSTEMCGRIADKGVQGHGGVSYISEYGIERF